MRIQLCLSLILLVANGILHGEEITPKSESYEAGKALRAIVDEAFQTPSVQWLNDSDPIQSLSYEGERYDGRPTSVFAFYASPATLGTTSNPTQSRTFPAVVLVHGGGGTAFAEWAWLWANRGYAVIAIDLSGRRPIDPAYDPVTGQPDFQHRVQAQTPTRLSDGGPEQGHREKFDSIGGDASDDWPLHAASNVLRAHSLIRSFDEVDPDRTAITGISWGGYTTCLAASLDPRFKAAVPVYGCGFLHEGESVQKPAIDELGDRREAWIMAYDPSSVLTQCRVPILFVNGTNDIHYPLDSYQKTVDVVSGDKKLRIEVQMRHGHSPGWAPKEIGWFIDSKCQDGTPLPRVLQFNTNGESVDVTYESKLPLQSAALHYTTDTGQRSKRKWRTVAAEFTDRSIMSAVPPQEANTWFISMTDQRGAMVTTNIQFTH